MHSVYHLVAVFSAQERLRLHNALQPDKTKGENKYLQLFEFLSSCSKPPSPGEASFAVYGSPADSKISKLAQRLRQKILDIIITESFLEANERLTHESAAWLSAKRKAFQVSVLYNLAGSGASTVELTEEAIAEASSSGAHAQLLELYHYKRGTASFTAGEKDFLQCTHKLQYHLKCFETNEKILGEYYRITNPQGFGRAEAAAEQAKKIKDFLDGIEKDKEYVTGAQHNYLLCVIRTEYLLLCDRAEEAKMRLGEFMLNLSLSDSDNGIIKAKLHSHIAACDLLSGNYDKSIAGYEHCLETFRNTNLFNYFVHLVSVFYPLFYSGRNAYAEKIVNEIISGGRYPINDFRSEEPKYFLACIRFREREFSAALKILNGLSALAKDKTGYEIAIRILRIQCLLELQRPDEASPQIENLRKHVSRHKSKNYISERNRLITQVLICMDKRGFSGAAEKQEAGLLEKLCSRERPLRWECRTPELIVFHHWYVDFHGHRNGRKTDRKKESQFQ
ncbi:MAG TPA: hypothetical protein VFU15_07345 [Bacteroidia bacterium]|nr:hypothetical protein [Bacteroidia bacterium]